MSRFFVRDKDGMRQVRIDRLMTIGRGPNNDLVLHASFASRRHAWAWRQGDRVIVEDLGSTYGTLLNGQPLTEAHFLQHNDVLQMGEAQITFVAERDPALEQTPPKGVPRLAPAQVFCTYCGAPNLAGARYCAQCGYTLSPEAGGDWQEVPAGPSTQRSQPITPLEPVIARPFPTAATASWNRSVTRTWVLILSLAIVAVFLVTIVGVLLVFVLG